MCIRDRSSCGPKTRRCRLRIRRSRPGRSSCGRSGIPWPSEMCIRDSTKGVEVFVRKVAPLGDPVEVTVRGYELSLRKADAEMIEVA